MDREDDIRPDEGEHAHQDGPGTQRDAAGRPREEHAGDRQARPEGQAGRQPQRRARPRRRTRDESPASPSGEAGPERRKAPRRERRAGGRDAGAYEPSGAKQFRAAPAHAAGSRHADAGRGLSPAAAAPYSQELMLAATAILALVSIIVAIATYTAPAAGDAPADAMTLAQAATPAERVAAAETSADENGIVHGTTAEGTAFTIRGAGEPARQEGKVTFAAVGDQIASDYSLELADSYAGEIGDGEYDFKPFYQEVKPLIQGADLSYVNQETVLIGGQDGYPVSGYPTFASPESCAESISDTGFDLVNFTTNHSYDAGTEGIEHSQRVWERYPQLLVGGSFHDEAARETVQLVERDGIRFAFLAYSYGDNSYEDPKDEPNSYYAVAFDKEAAAADIERARQVADCIIVSMHWGDEYTAEPNDQQRDWAQWLADQDVDLVIGTHAHNIQPVEYYTGSSGNRLPVVFGLGDFVSGWTLADTILSGIFTCDFVRQDNGRISVENPRWHPTVEWSDGTGQVRVRLLENMGVDEIDANTRTEDVPGSFAYLYNQTNSTITQIPVEWGSDAEDKAKRAAGEEAPESEGAADAQGIAAPAPGDAAEEEQEIAYDYSYGYAYDYDVADDDGIAPGDDGTAGDADGGADDDAFYDDADIAYGGEEYGEY